MPRGYNYSYLLLYIVDSFADLVMLQEEIEHSCVMAVGIQVIHTFLV